MMGMGMGAMGAASTGAPQIVKSPHLHTARLKCGSVYVVLIGAARGESARWDGSVATTRPLVKPRVRARRIPDGRRPGAGGARLDEEGAAEDARAGQRLPSPPGVGGEG